MHELSITQNIVEICETNAAGRRVRSVSLAIGELSGVIPESVEFCFEACSRGTLLEGAHLDIEQVAGRARHRNCGLEQSVASYYQACNRCGGYALEVLAGEELRVQRLEVE